MCEVVLLFLHMFLQCFLADKQYVKWDCVVSHCSDWFMMLKKRGSEIFCGTISKKI